MPAAARADRAEATRAPSSAPDSGAAATRTTCQIAPFRRTSTALRERDPIVSPMPLAMGVSAYFRAP